MPVLCDLIGPGAPLDATTASVIGLPRAGPRGSPWRFVRAALPHSLASELTSSTDRTTHGSYVKNISAILDQRKKASLERQPVPPRSHFERNLQSDDCNPADRVALAQVAKLIVSSTEPIRLQDAIALYVAIRRSFLTMVKHHHHPQLQIPSRPERLRTYAGC